MIPLIIIDIAIQNRGLNQKCKYVIIELIGVYGGKIYKLIRVNFNNDKLKL